MGNPNDKDSTSFIARASAEGGDLAEEFGTEPEPVMAERDAIRWTWASLAGLTLGIGIGLVLGLLAGWLIFAPSGEEAMVMPEETEEEVVVVPAAVEPGTAEVNGSMAPAEPETEPVVEPAEEPAASAPSQIEKQPAAPALESKIWICDRPEANAQFLPGGSPEKGWTLNCGGETWTCPPAAANYDYAAADCTKS